ncbi:MAG: hypothetical protein IJ071_04055 [Ruminococcus sp.]|nr:hypothetical protein [Ruminococcus sp.]
MRRITALLLAAALMGLCACGQTDPESSAEESSPEAAAEAPTEAEPTEAPTEAEEEPETEASAEEETEPAADELTEPEAAQEPDEVPELPEDITETLEKQLDSFREKDFEKWAEATDYDAMCDMLLEQIGLGEKADAQDTYYVMEQLAGGFSNIVETMPEQFSQIDSFAGRVEDISLTESDSDDQIKSELYSFAIKDTDMTGEFGIYHYKGSDIVILNSVV